MNKPRYVWSLVCVGLLATAAGCDDADVTGNGGADAGVGGEGGEGGDGGAGAAGNGGEGGEGGAGAAGNGGMGGAPGPDGGAGAPDGGDPVVPASCPDVEDRTEVIVDAEIDADTTWTCDNLYILPDLTYVIDDSVLTIEAGTVVLGDNGSALVITRGSEINSEGTAAAPVVLSTSLPEGSRIAGGWGGLVMLGNATINIDGGENQIEGISPTDDRGTYGGTDDEWNCGHLAYTRVEFAGYQFGTDNELNGVTLGGCGSETHLEYVQVHRGLDDGIELFGGRPNLDHIVVSSTDDDGLDWDQGFVGNIQFAVVQQDPEVAGSSDPNGMECDNNGDNNDAAPRSNPTLFNITLIGANYTSGHGMVLRRGTWGSIHNAIITGFATGIDVRDARTAEGTEEDPVALTVANSLFFDNGLDFPDEVTDPTADDDAAFDEEAFFTDAAQENVFGEDPLLSDAFDVEVPNFVPEAGSPAETGAATPGAGFDATAEYMGAFEPGGDDWSAGWTAYPVD